MDPETKAQSLLGGRRALLRGVAALGAAAAATLVPTEAEAHHAPSKKPKGRPRRHGTVLVFRFQTRNTQACNACKTHARYKVFKTHAAADAHRAHKGCHCPVSKQEIALRDHLRLFRRANDVADLRKRRWSRRA
jgi:hypothetical protein